MTTASARFGAGLSRSPDPAQAAREACAAARRGLGGAAPTLAVVFASPPLCEDAEDLLAAIHAELAPEHLIGSMGEAIVAEGQEVEEGPALAVWAAHLPGARVIPFRLVARPVAEGMGVLGWPDAVADAPAGNVGPILMLADPFTFPADGLLTQLNEEPGAPVVVGGLASGGQRPGDHRLFAGSRRPDRGRRRGGSPRGAHPHRRLPGLHADRARDGHHLGRGLHRARARGDAGARQAGGGHRRARPVERALAEDGLLTGLVIDENTPDYGRGDFLIRAIHGGDRDTGALVVGERVRVGQTMRFHVRDAGSADEDLRAALRDARGEMGDAAPGGALVFSCNGRGTRMFTSPHHDASAIAEELDRIPAAGLFCNGEIGPVGGKSFVHGFTATMAVFTVRRDVNQM